MLLRIRLASRGNNPLKVGIADRRGCQAHYFVSHHLEEALAAQGGRFALDEVVVLHEAIHKLLYQTSLQGRMLLAT